jgi:RNA polymerase sigma factor (sigma-70 family)
VNETIGTDAVFDVFATEARPGLLWLAFTLCHNWHEAEDLVQITLWRIFRHWPGLHDLGHLQGYTRRTLINAYLASRRTSRWSSEVLVAATPEPPPAEGHIDERLILMAAVRHLPPSQQQIVAMRYWADLSVGQTASALGCSVGNVTSQTTRALRSLRVFLDETGGR